MAYNKYVSFDWAAKNMLRDKANFCILEGLITVLLNEEVHIEEILESHTINDIHYDQAEPLILKAVNSQNNRILIKIQTTRELYYLESICFGTPQVTEHIHLGNKYDQVKKVYSINILYFDLGKGEDYIYRGQTSFVGLNKKDTLQITTKEKDVIQMKSPEEVFPEYYLIRVNAFDKIAQNHMEEWMRYLKDGDIDENTTAPGLMEAKRRLDYLNMSKAEQHAYDEHINAVMIQNDVISTAQREGHAEGRAEGEKSKALTIASNLLAMGMSIEQVAQATGLTPDEVKSL